MRDMLANEFIFQIFSLLIGFILVHGIYVAVIRPNAHAFLTEERQKLEADSNYVRERSYSVILRDPEQEACFVLMFWALAILAHKGTNTRRQREQLDQDLIGFPDGEEIFVNQASEISDRIQRLPEKSQEYLLPRVLVGAVERFSATRSVQDASTEVSDLCAQESDRLESELSTIRYIAWAIPSVGFIGTVRGIGEALSQAHQAVEGDITGVTESLGVAFNSTFIALVISIVLMFIIHQIQLMQERLVLDSRRYCAKWLIRRLNGGVEESSVRT